MQAAHTIIAVTAFSSGVLFRLIGGAYWMTFNVSIVNELLTVYHCC